MRREIFCRVILVVCLLYRQAACEDTVLELESGNIESIFQSNAHIALFFYVPWCRHSQAMLPEIEMVASHFKGRVTFGKVNGMKDKEIKRRWDVGYYPLLKLFSPLEGNSDEKKTSMLQYAGSYKAEAIIAWIETNIQPFVVSITSFGQIDDIQNCIKAGYLICAVGFFNQGRLEEQNNYTHAIYDRFRGPNFWKFYLVNDISILDQLLLLPNGIEVPEEAEIFVVKTGRVFRYDRPFSMDEISWWLGDKRKLPLWELTQDNIANLVRKGLGPSDTDTVPLLVVLHNNTDYRDILYETTQTLGDSIRLTFADGNSVAEFRKELGIFRLPAMCIIDSQKGEHFISDHTEITEANIVDFSERFLGGKLIPYVKSETQVVKKSGVDSRITLLIGTTFKDEVLLAEGNLLVYFYAAYCGFCQSFQVVYNELAKTATQSVKLAQIDLSKNGIPSNIHVDGFPSLKLFTANKQIIDYTGTHELNDLIVFLAEHTSLETSNGSTADQLRVEL
eukprot:TRINITY_DN4782_c0_g1_i2.p1 TRINITY_DN4782_c0_g1~~TRINITY_DN4782_c0_g1_i2.p1  ORF type:complete len:505 (-),score=62.51 TRINITY_DN4782_c0_g1_i2:221-1735(-)